MAKKPLNNKEYAAYCLRRAFYAMGGWQALAQWGKQNPTEFYRLWSKVLPKEVTTTIKQEYEPDTIVIEGVEVEDFKRQREIATRRMQIYRELIGEDDDDFPGDTLQ